MGVDMFMGLFAVIVIVSWLDLPTRSLFSGFQPLSHLLTSSEKSD